jgi:hypothetical protein
MSARPVYTVTLPSAAIATHESSVCGVLPPLRQHPVRRDAKPVGKLGDAERDDEGAGSFEELAAGETVFAQRGGGGFVQIRRRSLRDLR